VALVAASDKKLKLSPQRAVIIVFVGTAEINNNSLQHFVKHIVCITETEIEQHQIQKNEYIKFKKQTQS
jgi:hypothetical protein